MKHTTKKEEQIPKTETSPNRDEINDAKELDIAEETATSLYSVKEQLVYIVSSKRGDSLTLKLSEAPTIANGRITCEGDIVEKESDKLEGAFLGDLLPYLATRVRDNTKHLVFQDLEVISAEDEQPADIQEGTHIKKAIGQDMKFGSLAPKMATIGYRTQSGQVVVLSIGKGTRKVIVLKCAEDANTALMLFKSFPPFKEMKFYKGAEIFTIDELSEDKIKDENFVYFNDWQSLIQQITA